ncbi:glycosyltransferase family protein [Actinomyces minihominis]|uniref:glycosyltransferase family protein n=1 Tax=Actinomyces minihominis TaxID=2002838 RepID=UPI001F5C2AB5|nr:glycosyltransferase [Actinomyces minihominis]
MAAAQEETAIDVFSRFAGADDNYVFPEEYQKFVRGELTYDQMLTAYRAYKVILNVNSVPTSQSMCGRRVFEVSACGTPVLSAPTPAIDNAFPGGTIPQAADEETAYNWTRALLRSPELRDRLTHLSQREIWQQHTYTKRVNQILSDVGLEKWVVEAPLVSALVSTNRPHQLEHVLGQMAAQQDVRLEVLVLCHGFTLEDARKAQLEEQFGAVTWIEEDPSTPLGECYNILARQARGEIVAKIDDDDYYGPHYLAEQVAALDYADADVVGKAAHHLYLEGQDATVLRFPETEHKYRPFVSGPTIVAKRDVVLAHPFPATFRGEDTGFLKSVTESGGKVFSSSRFGFMQVRKVSDRHTWDIGDLEILATGQLVAYGKALDHVIF